MNPEFKPGQNDSPRLDRTPGKDKLDQLLDQHLDRLLDQHLAGTADLAPSSGFVLAVMESVHAHASEPPPIAFPWGRVVPGIIAVACGLLTLLVLVVRAIKAGPALHRPVGVAMNHHLTSASSFSPSALTFYSILLAACLSVAAVALSFRLTRRGQ